MMHRGLAGVFFTGLLLLAVYPLYEAWNAVGVKGPLLGICGLFFGALIMYSGMQTYVQANPYYGGFFVICFVIAGASVWFADKASNSVIGLIVIGALCVAIIIDQTSDLFSKIFSKYSQSV